ncbi:MAG TPA: exonuclease domain-containing protein [Geothrix sp.]|nr:exonuclease domain-containing protein [Geothrix sp.]
MPSVRVAYVDTETTGLSSNLDRIIEIAIVLAEVEWETGRITQKLEEYQGLQDPGRRIPAAAMAVHGISDTMVRGHRIDARACTRLLAAADLCLAHNSGFDKGFVAQIVPEAQTYSWGCTCRGIPWKKLYPSVSSTALQNLSRFFGSGKGIAHRALGDVETTMNLVSLPGILGARTFQHYVLHKKVRREDLKPDVVQGPDPAFMEWLIR